MTENLYTPDCIRTYTGKYVNVFDPKPEMFCIEDVAHALAQIPRFGGHLPGKLSVAQHSLSCWSKAPRRYQMEALLHDAAEAYLGDLGSPIKRRLPDYGSLELSIMQVIAKRFDFQYPKSCTVSAIDREQLEYEWKYYMIEGNTSGLMDEIHAEQSFLNAYYKTIQ